MKRISSIHPSTWNMGVFVCYFGYTICSGAFRKWVFPGSPFGDFLLVLQLLVPFSFLAFRPFQWRNATMYILAIYTAILFLYCLNPFSHTPFHAVLGGVIYLNTWVGLLLGLLHIKKMPLEKFIPLFIVVALLEFGLGIIQRQMPMGHWLNVYANGASNVTKLGSSIRVAGTFSYIDGFGAYVIFWGQCLLAMAWLKYKPIYVFLGTALGLLAAFYSGSRGPIIQYVFYTGIALVYLFWQQRNSIWKQGLGAMAILAALLSSLFLVPSLRDVLKGVWYRFHENWRSGEIIQRILQPWNDVFHYNGPHPWLGNGLGATYQGAVARFGLSPLLEPYRYVEDPKLRIILEGGYVLFLIQVTLLFVFLKGTSFPLWLKVCIAMLWGFSTVLPHMTNQAAFIIFGLLLLERVYQFRLNLVE